MHNTPLKPVPYLVMLLLAERPSYGVELLVRMDERSGGAIRLNPGSLYRVIAQLVEDGLLRPAAEEAAEGGAGAPRKLYGVTPAGREALGREAKRQAEWLALARSLDLLEEPR